MCQRSSYPLYRVIHNIKWVTTSWTDGISVTAFVQKLSKDYRGSRLENGTDHLQIIINRELVILVGSGYMFYIEVVPGSVFGKMPNPNYINFYIGRKTFNPLRTTLFSVPQGPTPPPFDSSENLYVEYSICTYTTIKFCLKNFQF